MHVNSTLRRNSQTTFWKKSYMKCTLLLVLQFLVGPPPASVAHNKIFIRRSRLRQSESHSKFKSFPNLEWGGNFQHWHPLLSYWQLYSMLSQQHHRRLALEETSSKCSTMRNKIWNGGKEDEKEENRLFNVTFHSSAHYLAGNRSYAFQ